MVNSHDRSAFNMIEANKKLDGIAVIDPDKIINDFKSNNLYRPEPANSNDYNILGEVPRVGPDLA